MSALALSITQQSIYCIIFEGGTQGLGTSGFELDSFGQTIEGNALF